MRIVHVIDRLDPAAGGPITVVSGLCPALAGVGHAVRLVALHVPGRDEVIRQSLQTTPGMSAVDVRILQRPTFLQQLRGSELQRQLRPLLQDAQAVHLHGVWDPILVAAHHVAVQQKVPFCLSSHGMLDPWSMHNRAWKKQLALRLGYRAMLNRAAVLHATTSTEADSHRLLKLQPSSQVIGLGIHQADFAAAPDPGTAYQRFPQLQGRPYVLFLGRIHPVKGLDYLAGAFDIVARQDPELQLVVAGPDGGALAGFIEQITAAGLNDRVHVVGPQWGVDKMSLMADAVCFCLPSRQENFGMVVIESLWVRTPVVISDQVQLCDAVRNGNCGIVVPLDVNKVAEAILQLHRHREQRQAMGDAGRKLVEEQFLWPSVVREYERMYQNMANLKE